MSQTAIERHDHWRVTVETSGEHIVSIEPEMLAGREPSEADYDAIRTAAQHLLSFAASVVDPLDFRCEACNSRTFAIVQGGNGKPTAAIRCVECKRVYNTYAPPALANTQGGVKVTCEKCGGEGTLYTSKYGGNDPDVWPVGTCEECEGTGKCQYAEDVSMPEYHCVGECYYAKHRPLSAITLQGEPVGYMRKSAIKALKDTDTESFEGVHTMVSRYPNKYNTEPLYTAPTLAHQPVTAGLEKGLIPRAENCGRYLAECNDGSLMYLNHADTWQGCPNFITNASVKNLEKIELVKRLKHQQPNEIGQYAREARYTLQPLLSEAAATIARLTTERDAAIAERQKSAREWRTAFDEMHQRAMAAEKRVRELEVGIKRLSDEEELLAETTDGDMFSMVSLAAKLAHVEKALREESNQLGYALGVNKVLDAENERLHDLLEAGIIHDANLTGPKVMGVNASGAARSIRTYIPEFYDLRRARAAREGM